MTDVAAPVDPPADESSYIGDAAGLTCDVPGCGWAPNPAAPNGPALLGSHRSRAHGIAGRKRAGQKRAPRDKAPRSIKVDLGSGRPTTAKKDPAIEAVRKRAEGLAGMVAVGLLIAGAEADAGDVEAGKVRWAAAVANLAQYEDWLRKLGQGGETSDRMMAWIQLAVATGAIALPILLRHDAIPDQIARFLLMAVPSEPAAAADEPVAA